jgi:uncharacterized protein (DUF983 family)
MSLSRPLGRALRLRCPACGGSPLFRRGMAMHEACASCGLDFLQEPGYYVGAMWLNYAAAAASGLAAGLLLVGRVPTGPLVGCLMAWGALCPVLCFRRSRALWLALDLWVRRRAA